MNIELNKLFAARRNSMAFHKRHGVKGIDEIKLHKLSWPDLNAIQNEAAKEARAMLDKAGKLTDPDEMNSLTDAHDAFMHLFEASDWEKDQRNKLGSREPREHGGPWNRPSFDVAETGPGGAFSEDDAERSIALAPEQRFSTWAQAKGGSDELRGLSVGNYLRSMILGGKTDLERRALSEGSDSAGGYTVPDVLSADLIDLARAGSVCIKAGAMSVPLTSDNNNWAKVLSDPVPAWRLEAGDVAESDPTFGRVQMIPRSLAVRTKLSAELMEDSLNLAQELPRILAAAMAVELDRVALLGTGTAPQPRGIANTVGIGTHAVNAQISGFGDLSRARTAILTANQIPSAFIMHPRDEGSYTDLTATDGQPLAMPRALSQIPMLTTTSIPVDGGTGDDESTIFAGDFRRMIIGIRSDIRVEVVRASSYVSNLQYDMVAHMRADIAVTHANAFFTLTGVGRAA